MPAHIAALALSTHSGDIPVSATEEALYGLPEPLTDLGVPDTLEIAGVTQKKRKRGAVEDSDEPGSLTERRASHVRLLDCH